VSVRVATTSGVLVAAVVIGVLAGREHRLWDLTAERSLTLSDQTLAVLDELDDDVEVTAFLRRDEPGRVEAAALLDRYRKESRRIEWKLVDPDDSPGEVARLGVDPIYGGVAVRSGDEVELVPAATEQDLTSALARLARGRDDEVCVTTGHGEPPLLGASELLERSGFTITLLDLLAATEIPVSCTAVVVAGPTAPLGAAALAELAAWTEADGKLLVLADPATDADLSPLLEAFGLGLERGVVFEGDEAAVIGGDVTAPIIRTYSSAHPVVRRLAPTFLPGVQGVTVDDRAEARAPGLTVSRLADTSSLSYLETDPVAAAFDEGDDLPGPITVAAAADRSRNDGTEIRRSRLLVVGDVDFATDPFLGEAANGALFLRAVEWLTLGEDLAAISPNLPADRPLRLTDARVAYARLLLAGVVPLVFLLAGAMVWAVRRSR
jgi:ABC-type uncharacterized transport system involved in gliding motility auxiliary subunit